MATQPSRGHASSTLTGSPGTDHPPGAWPSPAPESVVSWLSSWGPMRFCGAVFRVCAGTLLLLPFQRGGSKRFTGYSLWVFVFSAPDLYLHTVHVPSSHGATTPPSGALPGVEPQGTELSLPPESPTYDALKPQRLSLCFGLYHVAGRTSHLWFAFHALPVKSHAVERSVPYPSPQKFSVPRHSRRAIPRQCLLPLLVPGLSLEMRFSPPEPSTASLIK